MLQYLFTPQHILTTFVRWGLRFVLSLLAVIVSLFLTLPAYAQEPTLQSTNPVRNAVTATLTTTITGNYDQNMNSTTVSSTTFAIHGMQSGLVTATHGVVNNHTLIVTPTHSFHQGDLGCFGRQQ